MTERATVFEKPYIGVETTAGTAPTSGYKVLPGISLEPAIKTNVEIFRPQGYKYPTVSAQGKEWTEIDIGGQLTYDEIVYILSSLITSTTPSGGGTAKTWTFNPSTSSPDAPKSFSVFQGTDAVRAWAYRYMLITSFGFTFDRAKIALKGSAMAQRTIDDKARWLTITGSGGTFDVTVNGQTASAVAYNASAATLQTALEGLSSVGSGNVTVTGGPGGTNPYLIIFTGAAAETELVFSADGASLTSGAATVGRVPPTATALDLVPVLPRTLDVYMADTYAGLSGASKAARTLMFDWSLGDRYKPIWPLNSSYDSWVSYVEGAPKGEVKIKAAADSESMPLLVNMRKGDTKFLEIRATGDAISGGGNYELQIQSAVKIKDIAKPSDEDGLLGIEFTGDIVDDATWGQAFKIAVVNTLASL